MLKLMVTGCIRWSRHIYVEHVTGCILEEPKRRQLKSAGHPPTGHPTAETTEVEVSMTRLPIDNNKQSYKSPHFTSHTASMQSTPFLLSTTSYKEDYLPPGTSHYLHHHQPALPLSPHQNHRTRTTSTSATRRSRLHSSPSLLLHLQRLLSMTTKTPQRVPGHLMSWSSKTTTSSTERLLSRCPTRRSSLHLQPNFQTHSQLHGIFSRKKAKTW